MIELSIIGISSAFIAGIISFLSPCVLPLVPGYLSYISGNTVRSENEGNRLLETHKTLKTLALSTSFVLGFSTVFIAFGASATALGQLLISYRYEANIVGGLIIIIFGISISGLVRINWLQKEFRYYGALPGGRGLSAYLLGMAFAFGWTPCIGPILGAILTLSATSGLMSGGTVLLAFYSIGLGVPFILAALYTEYFMRHAKRLKKHGRILQIITGGLLILMGVAMITGYLTDFSIWILKTMPWLGELG